MILVALIILAVDQITKYLAIQFLEFHLPISVIPNFFNLTLVHNKGAAFGLLSGIENDLLRLSLLWTATALALAFVGYIYKTEARGDKRLEFALGLIIAGALGNIIDRVIYGYVVDFFDFYWGSYHWPAFNVADSSICIGVIILVLFGKKKKT